MTKSTVVNIVNFLWFQTIWWLVILFQTNAVIPVSLLIMLWLWFTPTRRLDLLLMAIIALIGALLDSILMAVGVFQFPNSAYLFSTVEHWLVPIWLILLWAALAGTVQHSLMLFHQRPASAALGGAIFAPLSYIAGERFGAVTFGYSLLTTFILLAAIWALVFPLCFIVLRALRYKLERKIVPAQC